jgi:hypothetical protein
MNKSLQKKTRLLQIINFTFLFFISLNVNDVIGQTQPTMAVRGAINGFGNSAMTYRSSLNQTWIATVQAATTNATAGFLFANNGSFSPKWARGTSVTFNTQTDWFANGADGTYNQTNGRFYTFIIRDVASGSNTRGYVFETFTAPVSVSSVTQSPIAGSVATGNAVTITATTSANLPTGQGVFLRYTTNNFTSSTILNMTGSASTYTATIPATANTLGANVVYYVFTSGGTTPMAVADADFATINLNNNSGSNYNYTVVAPSTYTWNQTGTASWATDTNWSPPRTTPNTADILQFNNGATTTVTNIPVETVGGILVSGNTTVNLQPAGANTLTISNGVTGADLSVALGSALNANGASALSLALAAGATGSITGNMDFSVSANRILPTDSNSLTFNSGSKLTQNTGNSGNIFNNSGTANLVVFANGSTFDQRDGGNPFALTQPASKVTFQTGSLYKLSIANAPALAGRTYANFEYDAAGTASGSGGTAYSIDNLTVTQGTLNLNVTVASSVRGNISVVSAATLTFSPASAAAVNLNGAGVQTISNSGTLTVASNANLTVVSGSTVNFGTSVITGAGTFTAASGSTLRTGNTAGIASSGATGSVQTTTRSFNAGANYVYNGVTNQITGTGLPATVNTLTINNTGTSPNNVVTLTAITAITATSGSLTLTAGRLDLNAKQLTIPTGGSIAASAGDFTATAGPVFFVGTGSVSGTVNFPTVTIAGGVNFGSASNIVTSLQFNSGAFVNTNAPTYGSASTLIYNTTGTYGRNLEWSATSGKGYPNHVQIQNGTTLDLAANGFADRAIAGNLNLGLDGSPSAGSLTMGATTNKLTVGGNVVIGGNTSGTSVLTLSSANGGDIYLSGNWDTKTNGSYASNSRAVFFQGAGTSTVTTIGAAFDYLFINKTSGGSVSLANAINVTNTLSIATGASLNLGTFASTSGTLSLGGTSQTTGNSYGGTGSPADTINTTFFANNIGYLNVGSCGSYSLTSTSVASPSCNGSTASVTNTSNLGLGTYQMYYTLSGANTGSFNTIMSVTIAGYGVFNTVNLSNNGSTTITIDYIRNGCVSNIISGNTATFTVNSASTAAVISGTATICSGIATNLSVAITGGISPYSVVYTDGASNFTVSSYTSGAAISVSPTSNTTYTLVSVTSTGGCAGTGNSGSAVVTVNSASTAAVISGSAAICAGTPTNIQVAITGGTSPYTVVYSDGTLNSYVSGSNVSVSPTSTTSYTLTSVTDANGCVGTGNSGSAVVTIDATTSTDGGVTWSNGSPSASKSLVFDGSTGTISANLAGCSLRLINNATVTVASGFNIILDGKLTVDSGSTFTLNNNANLLQTTTIVNSGNIIVNRNSSALKRLDYTLWSSPVTGQGLYAFSKFTLPNRFYVYDTATDLYNNSVGFNLTGLQYPSPLVSPNGVDGTDNANVQFTNGIGYLIRVPYNHPTSPTVYNGIFTGVANNGPISATVSTALNGFNAVGNPYPSRLNVHNFIDGNTNITGPLYLWRKTNTTAVSSSYATLTKTAYVANGSAGGDTGTGFFPTGGGQEQDWVLNIGQGFIVKATSGSTISFTNSMRRSSNANQFFRNSQTTTSINNGLYWLNLIDNTGVYSQMAVGYSSEGTIADDRGIDGENINKEFYLTSLIGAGEYSIQGRPEFDPSDVVPLSYKALTSGNYSIAIDHADGLFTNTNQAIYLKDNLTASEHNLQTGAYNFTSVAGTFTNRFEIIYQSQLSIENPTFNASQVIVYKNELNDFVINSGTIIMASVKVFDIRGRLLLERNNINASQTNMTVGMANEVLLVQITSEDGVVVTKKVVR